MRTLRKHGVARRVHRARDGLEALQVLGLEEPRARHGALPRLIVLDLKLPKIGGVELLRILRAEVRTRLLPVVVLSSSREQRDLEECYRLGANSYVVKPVEFERFAEAVRGIGDYWLTINESVLPHR
ncbi:MAG: response regulator [Planctomycetes bacterium]|nr:response regulator [Planctomycetota bacterium]